MTTPAPLLTTAEVAAYFQVSERTLERWRARGIGPKWIRVYSSVRYHRSSVVAFLAQMQERSAQMQERP